MILIEPLIILIIISDGIIIVNSKLYSGPPHNYQGKGISLKYKKNEVIVVMNMKKRSLKFIIEGEDKGDCYTDIPLEKPIFPSVLLCNKDDSVEIIEINN